MIQKVFLTFTTHNNKKIKTLYSFLVRKPSLAYADCANPNPTSLLRRSLALPPPSSFGLLVLAAAMGLEGGNISRSVMPLRTVFFDRDEDDDDDGDEDEEGRCFCFLVGGSSSANERGRASASAANF